MRRAVIRRSRDDRGAEAVEFALISIPLLLLVVAIIQFGLAYEAQVNVTQAARSAARYAAICGSSGTCTITVAKNASIAAPGLDESKMTVTAQYCPIDVKPGDPSCTTGNCPTGSTQLTYNQVVTVAYPYQFTFGILYGGVAPAISITGKASLPCGG